MYKLATMILCGGLLFACDDEQDNDPTGDEQSIDAASTTGGDGDAAVIEKDWEWMECSCTSPECMEAACDVSSCGIGGSTFNQHMCPRAECTGDSDCGAGSVCTDVKYDPLSCGDSGKPGAVCGCGYLDGGFSVASLCLVQKDWKWTRCSVVPAECMQAACDLGLCGLGNSRYDENMCLRPVCVDDEDCDSGDKCIRMSVRQRLLNPKHDAVSCEAETDAGVCDCEVVETMSETEWVCVPPG